MIRIEGRMLVFGELWFDEPIPEKPAVDILKVHQRSAVPGGRECTVFHSLVNDLAGDEHTLFAAFGETNRYKIRRAEDRDDLEFEHVADPGAALDRFCDFYDAFARQKGLLGSYRNGLQAACDAGRLTLTMASRAGDALVWHAYVTHQGKATLLHSASHFRSLKSPGRAVIARANRWLHWRDMLTFKSLGYARFCWGGMFEDESPPEHANINSFKREFGGRPERTYNCTIPVTVKGRAAMIALRMADAVAVIKARRAQPSPST